MELQKILPALNASFNAIAGLLIILGLISIYQKKEKQHRNFMSAAFLVSSLFLISYLYYHINYPPVKFTGSGFLKSIYFFILITHIPLAALLVPLSITAIVMALKGRLATHKKIVKFLVPIWLYVSLTGVFIYILLY